MIDPDAVAFFDPPDVPLAHEPYLDVGLMPRAEAERLGALWHVRQARTLLAMLADVLRTTPGEDGDAEADRIAELFEAECQHVGGHIAALRQIRECRGWA